MSNHYINENRSFQASFLLNFSASSCSHKPRSFALYIDINGIYYRSLIINAIISDNCLSNSELDKLSTCFPAKWQAVTIANALQEIQKKLTKRKKQKNFSRYQLTILIALLNLLFKFCFFFFRASYIIRTGYETIDFHHSMSFTFSHSLSMNSLHFPRILLIRN